MKPVRALTELLERMVREEASDLHIADGEPVYLRVRGNLRAVDGVDADSALAALFEGLSSDERDRWTVESELDFALSHEGERFRIHVYRHSGLTAAAIRHLPNQIPTPEEIGVPEVVKNWTHNQSGLVIVTGPTGSGKSTTLASLANSIHQRTTRNIVTVEEPIEYQYPEGKSRIIQREVGKDVATFGQAVRAALRQDADVLIIGEMRDSETMEAALAVAETGHLVFATLHTNGAAQAIDRIIDAFPPSQQNLTRSRLSSSLLGVMYQRLIPTSAGSRVAAFEVLVANYAVRNLIREAKTFQIPNIMETARNEGMQPMAEELRRLTKTGVIEEETMYAFLSSNV